MRPRGKPSTPLWPTIKPKYPHATECLAKDRDVLLTFYDFPAEHWRHLRPTSPIESTFANIRVPRKLLANYGL
jgi:putative transposase